MHKKAFIGFAGAMLAAAACAVEWTNLTPENRIGGRMVSEGYLRGKVVLFDGRDYSKKEHAEDIAALQKIWTGYKSKPFIVLGGHSGAPGEALAKKLDKLGVTYPVYAGASPLVPKYAEGADEPTLVPVSGDCIRVYDASGRRLYSGDSIHKASGIAGSAIFSARRPAGPQVWKALLDYEIEFLPGQAYLRLKDLMDQKEEMAKLQAKYPADMRRYSETYAKLKDSEEVRKLAKLVELSRLVRDRDKSSKSSKRLTKSLLEKEIEKYEPLKKSSNPCIVQEAKNAIADMKFAAASMKK
ncbi:MAG: hypothetical protein K6F50_02390 [Kiritimatiellae bacterium]|nr:hypothetical protein [Kiritimatiellia bacterium]